MRSFSKPGVPLRPLLAMQWEQVQSFLLVFQLKYIHIPPWSLINRLKQFGVWFRCVEVFELGRHSVMSCTMRLESDSASGRTLRCAWLRGVHDKVSCTHDTHIVRKYNYFNFLYYSIFLHFCVLDFTVGRVKIFADLSMLLKGQSGNTFLTVKPVGIRMSQNILTLWSNIAMIARPSTKYCYSLFTKSLYW